MKLLVLLALLCSCRGARGNVVEKPTDVLRDSTWCLVTVVEGHTVVSCTSSLRFCKKAAKVARERGGWAGVERVGTCTTK